MKLGFLGIHTFYRSACIALMATAIVTTAVSANPISKYSSTAAKDALSSKDYPSETEAASSMEALFPGYGGYQVLLFGGDERSWLNVKFGKRVSDLYSVTMQNAPGHFANKANDIVEWRGRMVGGKFVPFALIYRISGFIEETQTTKTRLLVFGLRDGVAEFVGFTEGSGEDAKAKKLADDNFGKTAE